MPFQEPICFVLLGPSCCTLEQEDSNLTDLTVYSTRLCLLRKSLYLLTYWLTLESHQGAFRLTEYCVVTDVFSINHGIIYNVLIMHSLTL